jgi:hypothetical protein
MMRSAALAAIGFASISLGGCLTAASNIPVWEHFDACPDQSTFHEWVACAKEKRQAACVAGRCSSSSSTVVAYVDNLDQAVERRQVTEAEARRKWLQFRQEREVPGDSRDRVAFDKAVAATGAPVFCTSGKSMGC